MALSPKKTPISEVIRTRIEDVGRRYWANDNIADFIETEEEKWELIDELEGKFEGVLDSLLIDRHTDPNSMGTARRLAKMYINEIMSGRYDDQPAVTAFPNDDVDTRYQGMIVVRSELRSMCSHHHQPVAGVAYIGLLPGVKVIGLSKYTRIAQHCARRGTLQEELTKHIADEIQSHTGAKDLAVYIQGTHGCCENRGIMAHSSLTQTTELRGQFFNPSVKNEFLDYIKMQQQFAGTRT
jgi:GTP cyclohydrolase I